MRKQFLTTSIVLAFVVFANSAGAQESGIENADGNSDGKLTVAEFTEYVETKLEGFDQIEAFVKKVDVDGNGEISKDEFDNRFDVLQELQNAPADEPMQQEKKSDGKNKGKQAATKKDSATAAYNDLKKLIIASKWNDASKRMTKKAQDEFCVEQIMSAKGIIESDMPMQIPGFEELLDELEDAFEKHHLDDIDIDVGEMFKMEWKMGGGDGDEEDDESSDEKSDDGKKKGKAEKANKKLEDAHKKQEANQKKILKALDKEGNRWEVITDVWNAKQKSPFGMSTMTGQVESEEVIGDKAFLKVKMVPLPRDEDDDQPGVMIQIMSPPVFIQMEKADGKWKYAGRDQKRSEKAMKEFMENQQRSFGGGRDRADF